MLPSYFPSDCIEPGKLAKLCTARSDAKRPFLLHQQQKDKRVQHASFSICDKVYEDSISMSMILKFIIKIND
ncbi:hypothetical protein ACH33_11170 [Aneurinibacillus sp. XH2]|nr:hypothetical protein ACH33_11170 [Aneurinibacillus sp. XH2]